MLDMPLLLYDFGDVIAFGAEHSTIGTVAKFIRINARIGEIIANELKRPSWHEGDFFGETFSR